jgi:hypothetical protein
MNKMSIHGSSSETRTAWLPVERADQRLFKLPEALGESKAPFVIVVLNGYPCKAGNDYEITGSAFNWVSNRKLRQTDGLAVRYPLEDVPHLKVDLKGPKIVVQEKERETTTKTFRWSLTQHPTVEVRLTSEEAQEAPEEPEVDVVEEQQEQQEEEDMIPIEEGVKVWHRMTDEGPWIVIQRSTLKLRSSLAGGNNVNTYHDTFCETAWTVQTEDHGMVDFPEVVLTTKPPHAEPKKMALWKKLALVVGASGIAFGIVNAQWIAQLMGYWPQ